MFRIEVIISGILQYVQPALVFVYLLDFREEIRDNSTEQLQIILQELWHVHISNSTQNNKFLRAEQEQNNIDWNNQA